MMTKEKFIKVMSLIQNFESEQETVAVLINKITDGYPIVTIGNSLIEMLVEMINDDLDLTDRDLIDWWLYDGSKKIIYVTCEDEELEVSVETLEELYDYIVLIKDVEKNES